MFVSSQHGEKVATDTGRGSEIIGHEERAWGDEADREKQLRKEVTYLSELA